MTTPEHLPDARAAARETYERRRARAAADILATIPPARWDAMTRNVIATLAGRLPVPVGTCLRGHKHASGDMAAACNELPAVDPDHEQYGTDGRGAEDIRTAFLADLRRMGELEDPLLVPPRVPSLAGLRVRGAMDRYVERYGDTTAVDPDDEHRIGDPDA